MVAVRRGSLSDQVVQAIRERITGGVYARGEKLPTEQIMVEEFGVSRTVVREAIANLKAAGMVTARQGVGVFVQQHMTPEPFSIDPANINLIKNTLPVLELRIAIEAETAALAAERRADEHLDAMRSAMKTMELAIEAGEDSHHADFLFHQAIATATGNAHFLKLFDYLGELMIPHTRLETLALTGASRQAFLDRINEEHGRIFTAIEQRKPDPARAAMRLHLVGRMNRLRTMADA